MLKKLKLSLALCGIVGSTLLVSTVGAQHTSPPPPPHHTPGVPPHHTPGVPPSGFNSAEPAQRELRTAFDELGRLFYALNNDGVSDDQASSLLSRGEALYATAYSFYDSGNFTAASAYARAASAAARAGRQALTARFGMTSVVNPNLRRPPVITTPVTTVFEADRELQHAFKRLTDVTFLANQNPSINVQSDLATANAFYNQAISRYQNGDYAQAVAYSRVVREAAAIVEHLLRASGTSTVPPPPGGVRSMSRTGIGK